ncbi:MAG: hypothetical protein PHE36_04365 [Novosphingobium sp.]|nr:hypothetical protein [Novosphingobium sp.]
MRNQSANSRAIAAKRNLKLAPGNLALCAGIVLAASFAPAHAQVTVEGTETAPVVVGADKTLTVAPSGVIDVKAQNAIKIAGSNGAITNKGTIRTAAPAEDAINGQGQDNLIVVNDGVIHAAGKSEKAIEGNANLTVVNNGTIESAISEAIEADAAGLALINNGKILAYLDDGIDGDNDVTLVNNGLIQGGENDGMEMNNGTVDNRGTIVSLSSDPEGSLVPGGSAPELDAGIDFDAGIDGREDSIVWNREGAVIEGDIGIVASPGNQDAPETNDGRQEIHNWGTIAGRKGDAALLGNGDDLFVLYDTGTTHGTVDGQAGNDTLVFSNMGDDPFTVDLGRIDADGGFKGFEKVVFDGTGTVTVTGTTERELYLVSGGLRVDGKLGGTLHLSSGTALAVGAEGSIDARGGRAVAVEGDKIAITNNGLIRTAAGDDTFENTRDTLTVVNNGKIVAD